MSAAILYVQNRNLVLRLLRMVSRFLYPLLQEPPDPIAALIENLQVVFLRYITPLAGLVMIGVLAWAGWTWMTAGPNQSQVKKAKDILKNGGIGAGIFLGCVVLADVVLAIVREALGVDE